ncbi:MAG: hypothetical protein IJE00_01265 [Clostridia bacterium]|nr:hypothetical protein [Clostridia bacterium]
MVTIVVPAEEDGAKERFIGVNDYTAKVKVGKPVQVPDYVVAMMQDRDKTIDQAQTRSEALAAQAAE